MRSFITTIATVVMTILAGAVIAIGGFGLFFFISMNDGGGIPILFAILGIPVLAAIGVLYFSFASMSQRSQLIGGILCSVILGGYGAFLYGRGIGQAGSSLPVSMVGLAAAFWLVHALRNHQGEQDAALKRQE